MSLRRVAPGRYGHLKGKERLEQTIRWVLVDLRIPFLTVYALSQENFAKRTPEVLPSLVPSPTAPCARLRVGARPCPCRRTWRCNRPDAPARGGRARVQELEDLLGLIATGLDELRGSADIQKHDIRVKIAGDVAALPPRLRAAAEAVEEATKLRGMGGVLTICLGYGGRQELVAAARRTALDYASGALSLDDINEQAISDRLSTAGVPDADLVVRTSGEKRISNFLLWHIAYAELFFSPLPWPAFDAGEGPTLAPCAPLPRAHAAALCAALMRSMELPSCARALSVAVSLSCSACLIRALRCVCGRCVGRGAGALCAA